jgi:4-hydroxy-tetrahydrodipicolinate reductase
MGLWPDLDIICPLLESGKHVLLTGGLIFPAYLGKEVVDRLEAACRKGNASVYGGGLSPGFVETIAPISLTNLVRRADMIVIEEFADFHDIPESAELLQSMLGLGRTPEDVRDNKHPYFDDMMPSFFNQSLALLADAVKLKVDRYETDIEHIPSPQGAKLHSFDIPPGTIGGVIATFTAVANDRPRLRIQVNWIAAPDLQHRVFRKDDLSNSTQWRVTVEGDPSLRLTFEQSDSFFGAPTDDARKSTDHSFIITAMNVINAIPYVCAAPEPGIKHHGNLPLMAGRYVMRE